ncbi:META domain-containing protein [Pedobacter rhodius]|uniref:META domain-containing protein n=1 Tax=Pedobacter rhodius TaxID=3004098 RepID=A0ABT4KSI5_9SPHI|nr:META domain-containing protein [Pedobacter sp. SJ11]MCZ4221892.1 META domain-containing protein [Pedobacter sp. SJ11]
MDPNSFKNTKWELTQLTGKILPQNAKATLNFNDSLNVTGKSFCNNYGGRLEIKDNQVKLKNVYGTKMFCEETASEENAFLNALNEVNGAKVVDGKLELRKGDQTLLVFTEVN